MSEHEIAIVGMSGHFPGCLRQGGAEERLAAFWRNLREGVESISFFSEQELAASGVDAALYRDPRYVPAAAVADGAELFDAAFFGISPRDAALTDPQHRVFLELAWETLENAGVDPARFGGPIGVFAAASLTRCALSRLAGARRGAEALQVDLGNEKDHLPTRVSYKLDLRGPSVNVQTACSSSLVAVHLACQSLLVGDCDLALAGGVSLAVPARQGYLWQEGGVTSPDGHCRAFDAAAAGTVGGQGLGVVLLERLADARAGGDLVRAVIKGSAVNNDGAARVGYAAPGVAGQAAVVAEALAVAGVAPETISYVEAHGSGTPLGDAVEIAALCQAFGRAGGPGSCALGSVKTNVGHLDAAAGVAGLIKAVLALERGEIPPTLHFSAPHPDVDLAASPFYVNARRRPWPRRGPPRRAGVSSFGVGGTNVHLVLEEAPPAAAAAPSRRSHQLLALSAKTSSALAAAAGNLAAHLRRHPELELADVAFTLQVGRQAFVHRSTVVAADVGSAIAALESGAGRSSRAPGEPPVIFLFPGQGTQYPNMGRELYREEPVFRHELDHCRELLAPVLDLERILFPPSEGGAGGGAALRRTSLAQPALFAVEYALARQFMAWGARPHAMVGHSVGELVAACLAGVFSLADALSLVALRGRLVEEVAAGAMLSVPLPAAEVEARLGPELSLAAINAPARCTVAGSPAAIDSLERELAAGGVSCRRLRVAHAFHSPAVESVLRPFAEAVASARPRAPEIPFLSNVTGTWITPAEATDPGYWARHLRLPVRFAENLGHALEADGPVLLEVGPGRSLSALARQHPASVTAGDLVSSLPAAQEGRPATAAVTEALGRLWSAGVTVDWDAYHRHQRRRRVELPTYPFERRRFGVEGTEPAARKPDPADWLYLPVWRPSAAAPAAGAAAGRWLVLAAGDSLSSALADGLRGRGGTVVRVMPGERFARRDGATYVVRPAAADDSRRLVVEALSGGPPLRGVVHMWSLTGDAEPCPEAWEPALERGFSGLAALVPALAAAAGGNAWRLVVVCDRVQDVSGEEAIDPAKSTLLALCPVIPLEYPGVACRAVDVRVPQAGSRHERRLVEMLLRELVDDLPGTAVAYRGDRRWVRDAEAVRLEPAAVSARPRRRGAYLVTGGLGRVGLAVAESLTRDFAARLVLTGRDRLPPRGEWDRWLASPGADERTRRKILAVRALEELGAEVLAVAADAGDLEQMCRTVELAEERWGRIDGVLHAAGVTRDETFVALAETRREHVEEHFRPKVRGVLVLERLFRSRPPDFFLLFSSLSTLLGGVGFAGYAAANQFMDAFAHDRSRTGTVPWISVCWDGWRFRDRFPGEPTRNPAMTAAEGCEVLRRVLAAGVAGQVLVSTSDLRARIDRLPQSMVGRAAPSSGEVPPDPPFVIAESDLERRIAGVLGDVLGIARVGADDNFFELGGDSLLAAQVLARLRRNGLEIPLSRFFTAATVADLVSAVKPSLAPRSG